MYFSGFSFKDEKVFFEKYLVENNFTISGFSYGAIKAIDKTYELIKQNKRVDLLQLFSPAYFDDKDEKFKRLQMMFFKKDSKAYCENFIENTIYPNMKLKDEVLKYFHMGNNSELEELLYHKCNFDKIKFLKDSKVEIEVYLGEKDKIIDPIKAKEFYINFSQIYFIKNVGHLLN